MPLPPFILQGFDYINHSTTHESDYYGVYNTLLGVSFPQSQGYTVHFQPVQTSLSPSDQVNFPIYFRIDRNGISLLFLEIKTEDTLASRAARIEADSEMRLHISQLDEQSQISVLSGVSAFGRKLSFYSFHKANRSVSPTFIHRDGDDPAPADRWGWDVTTDKGFEKWEAVTAQVKSLALHEADIHASMADLQIAENCLHSPILRQLPSEIISYIFNFTLLEFSIFVPPTPIRYPYYPPTEKNQCITPFVLGAVCRDWRAIAWSTPVLWSSMVVFFNTSTFRYNRSALVKDWLSRSGQLPLSIRIFVRPITLSVKPKMDFGYLAGIIKQYSSRWRHFELSAQSNIARYFGAERSYAPILESLLLAIPDSRHKFDLVVCPRLKKVHLASVPLSNFNFSWIRVTHICIQLLYFEDYFEILRNTPLLVHAEFIGGRDRVPYPPHTITTPLRSLKVVAETPILLKYITCPFLDELVYDVRGVIVAREFEVIIPFLGRSGPLRSFSMLDFYFCMPALDGPSILVELLQAMPSLTNLVLSKVGYDVDNILHIFGMIQSSQPRFLPYLETVDYTGYIIHNRNSLPLPPLANSSLQLIKLKIPPTFRMPKNVVAFFLRLVERGVKVEVRSGSEDDVLQSCNDFCRDREELSRRDWADNLDLSLMQDLF